jgi:hypothetical protein
MLVASFVKHNDNDRQRARVCNSATVMGILLKCPSPLKQSGVWSEPRSILFLATIEPWDGRGWCLDDPPGRSIRGVIWDRPVIDSSFRNGYPLVCGDLEGDGNDGIAAGYRGAGTSLYLYQCLDASGTRWGRVLLDNEMAASCAAIADVSGDGRLDIVAIGSATANGKWYENLGGN